MFILFVLSLFLLRLNLLECTDPAEFGITVDSATQCSTYDPKRDRHGVSRYVSFIEALYVHSHNPCADFYKYACHCFDHAHRNEPDFDRYHELQLTVTQQKKDLITDKALLSSQKSSAVQVMIKFRDACMLKHKNSLSTCYNAIESYFHHVVDYLYLQKYWFSRPKEEIKYIEDMVENVMNSFGILLKKNEKWLSAGGQKFWTGVDPDSKNKAKMNVFSKEKEKKVSHTPYEHAVQKLKHMKRFIGGYPFIMKVQNLDFLYSHYEIDETLEYEALCKVLKRNDELIGMKQIDPKLTGFDHPKSIEYLDQAITRLKTRTTVVNCRYAPPFNAIVINAAILQKPFFDMSYPDAVNYGRIGWSIGHEITHGFDNQGKDYDVYGNKEKWLDGSALQKFESRIPKVKQLYTNPHVLPYPVNGATLNLDNTIGENIADQGGLLLAHHALLNLKQKSKTEMPLGLQRILALNDDTPYYHISKLFFTSYATRFCDIRSLPINEVKLRKKLQDDAHAPNYSRVNIVVGNNEVFKKVFGCSHLDHPKTTPVNQFNLWTFNGLNDE